MVYESRDFLIYFGKKDRSICPKSFKKSRNSLELEKLSKEYNVSNFIVLDQIHSNIGMSVDKTTFSFKKDSFFEYQGDFLVTDQKNIGLIVLTADCVPLVLYDFVNHVVSVIHAGWRGTFAGIIDQALKKMMNSYGSSTANIKAFFGPSAQSCCYQVEQDFVSLFQDKYGEVKEFFYRDNKIYFDNKLFLKQNLKKFGILESNINFENSLCTICNKEFCSFRREKEQAQRQITMVVLR